MSENIAFVDRPQLRVLSREKAERIHEATLQVLGRTGVKVLVPEAVDLLAGAGAVVENGNLVKIPRRLVEECLDLVPSSISVYNRNGQLAMQLEGQNIYFGTGPTIQYVIDVNTGERRSSTMEDIEKAARIVDYLPNLDYAMTMGMSGGMDPETNLGLSPKLTDRFDFVAMLQNTTKPLIFSNWSAEGLADCYEMAVAVRGGNEQSMREAPFIIHYCEPTTPLTHGKDPLEEVLYCAEKLIPLIYVSGQVIGGTSPVTMASCLVLANAEFLSGLVIAQLKKKGAPMIYGGGASPLDMRTGVNLYAGPDFCLNHIALKELSNFYNLPDFNTGGCTDAKRLDQQAAVEYAMSLFQAALIGSNLTHDVGYIESGYTACWEGIILGDEIIDALKHFIKGVTVSDETLALDLIQAKGPGGSFIAEPHTYEHFRSVWYPKIFDRTNHNGWVRSGNKVLGTRLTEKVHEILTNHTPEALDDGVMSKVNAIIARAKENNPVKNKP